jgi:hypothetical protein
MNHNLLARANRSLAALVVLSTTPVWGQFEPPEPPAEESPIDRSEAAAAENRSERDNSPPPVTERSQGDREIPADNQRDVPRNDDTHYVPDPRPGGMSEPQPNFDVERVRSADIGIWFDRSTADGLIINDVGAGAISRVGFREGDRIYSVNGVRVDSEAAFVRTLLDPRWRNERVSVVIYRHGRPWTVYMQPSVFVQEYSTVAYDPLEDWGLVLDDRYDDYVVVWRVRPRSPAFYAGLRAGDVIVNWQGRRLASRDDFIRLAGQGRLSEVALDINRNRQLRRIDLDLSGLEARATSRTSLRPDLDAAGGATAGGTIRVPSGVQTGVTSGGAVDGNVVVPEGAGVRSSAELQGRVRTGSRFESTIDGRLEGSPDGRLDRTNNRSLFPSNAPSGAPTPNVVPRGTVEVPGVPGGVRVQGSTRGGLIGGRRQ